MKHSSAVARRIGAIAIVIATLQLLAADAMADRRAAARSNLGGASRGGGGASARNVAPARGARPPVSRPNTSAPSLGRTPTNRPSVTRPPVNRPQPNRPQPNRPQPNRPQPNRPQPNRPAVTRPPANRPSISPPAANRPPVTRPELGGNRPGQSVTRPGGGVENRPAPEIRPPLSNRPELGNRPASRPSGDRVNDFLGIQRPGGDRPGPVRPGIERPNIDRPNLGRPGVDRPDRPGIERPDRPGRPDGNDRPGVGRPDRPGIERPGIERPGIERPGIERPGIERPGIERPGRPDGNDRPGIGRPDRPGIDRPDRPGPDRPGIGRPDRPGIDRPGMGRPDRPDRPEIGRPDWGGRPDRPIVGGDRNDRIHRRPPWVDMDRDRLGRVGNRWNNTIRTRPDDLHRWTQRRPDRVARWRSWGNHVRFRWDLRSRWVFGPVWWTTHRPVFSRWHHWHHWNRHTWNFWWGRPTFVTLTDWFVWSAPVAVWSQPIFYDFGSGGNVVFNDNRVFISGEDVGSVEEFAQSAADLATVPPPEDDAELEATEWMPLGTYAVSTSELEGAPTRFVQLAVNHDGIVSGTFFNSQTEVSQAVLGQVDPETQRVAVRLGEDDDLVIETGLYNLTLDEVPVLVHFGSRESEFFLLIRMEPPEDEWEDEEGIEASL